MNIIKVGSKHTYSKPNSRQFIILHHTGPGSLESIIKWLSDMPKSLQYTRASCHYVISKIGEIYSLVPDQFDAWHAGKSQAVLHRYDLQASQYKTELVQDLNDKSIGIEIHNDGNEGMYLPKQMEAVIELTKHLKNKYKIDPRCILGHEDIAQTKRDPGFYFDWDMLFQGLYK